MTRSPQRLPSTASVDDLVSAIREDGCVAVSALIDVDAVRLIREELEPHVDRRAPGHGDEATADFWGRNTKRFQGLASKSPAFVHHVVANDTLLAVADRILGPHSGDYWVSQTELIFIGPGEPAQELHRDDVNWAGAVPLGIDLLFSTLVAVGDYDAEAGATLVVPGSHLWPRDQNPPVVEPVPVELEPGDALVYLGSVLHGGGHNSTASRWREALYCGYLLSWLTPEEATALSVTPEQAAQMSPRARQLLGWASQRGTRGTSGVGGAMQLWQLDSDDTERHAGTFRNR